MAKLAEDGEIEEIIKSNFQLPKYINNEQNGMNGKYSNNDIRPFGMKCNKMNSANNDSSDAELNDTGIDLNSEQKGKGMNDINYCVCFCFCFLVLFASILMGGVFFACLFVMFLFGYCKKRFWFDVICVWFGFRWIGILLE